jgi:hypothetical protein
MTLPRGDPPHFEWPYARWQELDDWIEEARTGGHVMVGAKAR